jgi:hypothetical protein
MTCPLIGDEHEWCQSDRNADVADTEDAEPDASFSAGNQRDT